MNIIKLAQERFGRRRKITRDEMATILADHSHAHPGVLANSYMPDTFPRDIAALGLQASDENVSALWSEQPDAYHRTAALAWAKSCRGLNIISVGETLRDGAVRYDQPGSMHPLQMSDLSFASDSNRPETLEHLRRHCRRLLLVRHDLEITAPDPDSALAA